MNVMYDCVWFMINVSWSFLNDNDKSDNGHVKGILTYTHKMYEWMKLMKMKWMSLLEGFLNGTLLNESGIFGLSLYVSRYVESNSNLNIVKSFQINKW